MKKHVISSVSENSIAKELGFEPGDSIISINGEEIEDVFDYRFLTMNELLTIDVLTKDGEEVSVEIEKDSYEDLGLEFENSFMDSYRSCKNKCIFCFIDQLPKGMRETLYFKDDDSRLSFLQGNYVTLTNISEKDINKIIKYKLEPINISFQTMNPDLRCKMLNNRFAGDALKWVDVLFENNISMNGQIVLCKGINDGKELEFSLEKLYSYLPLLESVSVVPVGLTKFREGLYPLEPFTKEDAVEVIGIINKWQKKALDEFDTHFIHASDEWYILAGLPLPEEESYDGYLQLENGVGMITSFKNDFTDMLKQLKEDGKTDKNIAKALKKKRKITVPSGALAYDIFKDFYRESLSDFPDTEFETVKIINQFFGERITVTGLITGRDLVDTLKGQSLGDRLYIFENMLKAGENIFLDDMTVEQVEKALQVKCDIVKSNGRDFCLHLFDCEEFY